MCYNIKYAKKALKYLKIMNKIKQDIQVIKNNGKPEWAVMPYDKYLELSEMLELYEISRDFNDELNNGKEEMLPANFAERILINEESPVKVWREYRNISQKELAEQANISIPYLSQIEHKKRSASLSKLKIIAEILSVQLDDLA